MNGFQELLALGSARELPPLHLWHPARTESIAIRIAADGRWFHEDGEIKRRAMCRLFGSLLRCEDGVFYLVTPQVKYRISVEDAPFIAVDMEWSGEGRERTIAFRTNLDEAVVADAEHPIIVEDRAGEPRPYLVVRDALRALIARSLYYRMADLASPRGEKDGLVIWTSGKAFRLL